MKFIAQISIMFVFMQACGTGEQLPASKTERKQENTDAGSATNNDSATATAQSHAITAGQVVTVIGHLTVALDLLDLIPKYECGEPRRTFVGRVTPNLQSEIGCVKVLTTAEATRDLVTLSFDAAGCKVDGHTLSGDISIAYSGGEDRFDMLMDVSKAKIDGRSIPAQVGYGTCGDETRYSASSYGTLENAPLTSYAFATQVGIRDGLPLIGSKSFVFNGMGAIVNSKGTDAVTVSDLEYSLGDLFPSNGSLRVATATGTNVNVKFDKGLWKLGTAEITVDQNKPVTVPLMR